MTNKKFKLIDLFCGAGGLSLGFAGKEFGHNFKSIWANDFNQYAANTYNANFGKHCVVGDIVDILKDPKVKIPEADVVIGGPPCQGFSLLNKNRDGDPRRHLWRPYMDVVERSGAEIFVMENVPQILDSAEFEDIAEYAEKLGFFLTKAKLCAADYGVSQIRFRAFIIGCRFIDPNNFFPPLKTHYNPNLGPVLPLKIQNEYISDARPWQTVRDAIGDLPRPVGTQIREEDPPLNLHFGRTPTETSLRRYESIPNEGMNRFDLQKRAPELTPKCWIKKTSGGTDLFGRLWWDRPSVTIRTEFFKPEKGRYLHPCQHRPITHREAARIQSFPDSFRFLGSKIEIAKQIGNAVPPRLAAEIAGCVENLLNARSKEKSA
ncbi:dna methylase c-5 cytosine-specific active site [Lucifera butyrica]|uniref:Cytosine-specific methyltransferase n=1 Tax=Lucifera butyrica TaxID=1351585 RepID=A0A498R5V5_9FIRM|nr:DNA cytosine methyltransferase [Lucifera butyrica]VBB05622.1 dna methylase c-5 cytosine-specific active site [Lucifera butyrica]